jgi:uncharacterized protein (TIGR02598 family)
MKTSLRNISAFSLIEVTLALGVAAFCLVTVFGLLPIGINSNQISIQQTSAANLAKGIVSDMRATEMSTPVATTSAIYKIPMPVAASGTSTATLYLRDDGSTGTTAVNHNADPTQNPRYRATLFFNPPASGRASTPVRILVTWPALADPTWSSTPAAYTGYYETITTLDRN